MEIALTLALPREGVSVPAARRFLASGLSTLGVERGTISDIELAVTEACANVLEHATEGDEYEVCVSINGRACTIDVHNSGEAFDGNTRGLEDADTGSEDGRGIQLMRALVDTVSYQQADDGTIVHLEKQLTWDEDSVMEQLKATDDRLERTG